MRWHMQGWAAAWYYCQAAEFRNTAMFQICAAHDSSPAMTTARSASHKSPCLANRINATTIAQKLAHQVVVQTFAIRVMIIAAKQSLASAGNVRQLNATLGIVWWATVALRFLSSRLARVQF